MFFLSGNLLAQTTITGKVTDAANAPVPFAAVYLSKTTIGNMTNNEGDYTLTIPQDGEYELIASFIGFKSFSSKIIVEGKPLKIDIKLAASPVLLDEITVQSKKKVKNRVQNLSQFNALFLGQTENAEDCKILNPEDIYLTSDPKSGFITGHSLQSIRIENKSLGYLLRYDLADFNFDARNGFVKFNGSSFFQPLYGNARSTKLWARKRLEAYYGSRTHFLRALFSDSLRRENYQLFELVINRLTKDTLKINPIQENFIRRSRNASFMKVFSGNPILIKYTDKHQELSTDLLGFTSRTFSTTIQFSDTLKVFNNGFFANPYAVTWYGEMADERIADMLPVDFQPHSPVKNSQAQVVVVSPVEKYLTEQQKLTSRDQVFVQLDRSIYKPGDTIFFQAYLRDRFTGIFDSKSISLYALLFNEQKVLADSARFKVSNSTASGWMTIPVKAVPGKYHFSAFTGRMQNGDPVEAFQLDLYVREQSGNPDRIDVTFDKASYLPGDTLEATVRITDPVGNPIPRQRFSGSFSSDQSSGQSDETETNIKGESLVRFTLPDTISAQPRLKITTRQNPNNPSLTREVNIPCEVRTFELRFLPEGGTFVEGLIQNVGFNATNLKGEPVAITGLLKNSAGTTLDTLRSGPWGPGNFYCKATAGLYVEILKGAEKGKRWPLPVPTAKGITLSVEPADSRSFEVEIQSSDYNNDPVTVSVVMNLKQVFSKELILSGRQRFTFDTDQFPSGVAGITLFDKASRPIAERLLFVNSDQRLKFTIQTGKSQMHPGEETELSVLVTDGQGRTAEGFFSVAVTDSASGNASDLFIPGIEYSYKYHPAFPGNLPAKVLAKGVENLTDEERNLLLMVYGWSKFNWDFTSTKSIEKQFVNYDLLNLKVLYASKRHLAGRSLDLMSLEGPSARHLTTDENGEISLPLDSLPEITRSVMIMPDVKSKEKALGSLLSIPYNEQYFKSNKLFVQQPVVPSDEYNVYRPYHYVSMGEKMIEIPEVTITARPDGKKVFHDKQEEFYQFNHVKSLEPEMIWMASTLENAIRRLVTPYLVTPDAVYLHAPLSFFHGSVPVLFVLDGLPLIHEGWPQVNMISPGDITSLTILDGKQGFMRYGEAAQQGVIFVNTRSNNPDLKALRTKWVAQNSNDKMLQPMILYRPTIEYYNPTKIQVDAEPILQNRATILWEAEHYFNGKEPVKIKYTNLKHEGPVVITINGVSVNNLMGTGRGRYLVQ